jgi:YggT family protein
MTNIVPLLITTISSFIGIYSTLIIARLLLTWFPNIDWMQQIAGFLSPITDPYLNLFRFIPPIGGTLDISPILALLALQLAGDLIKPLAASYAFTPYGY